MITSLQNPRVKNAVHLRDARQRRRRGRIIIDGVRELSSAVSAGVRVTEVFVCEPLPAGDAVRELIDALKPTGCEILHVAPPVFEKMAFGSRSEGILGVAETPHKTLDDLDEILSGSARGAEHVAKNPLVAVLEGAEKPGNIGAVLRSADAADISALILCDARTDLYNPNAIRASLGTIFTMPVCEATSDEAIRLLRGKEMAIVAARVDGSAAYTEIDFRRPAAVVLGSEAHGLSSAWTAPDIIPVRLPMLGKADSLNVSAAAAVLFYEALRQRRSKECEK